MEKNSCRLILGSASPRRKELLAWLGVPFEVVPSNAKEESSKESAADYVLDLAQLKARDVYENLSAKEGAIVLGSDTVVALENRIMEKPRDREHAKEMLKSLSGKWHDVYTAVCLVHKNLEKSFYEKTSVKFEEIDEKTLEIYLDSGESLDKAGAYGIQGAALAFISEVRGSYSSVVGLPTSRVLKELREMTGKLLGVGPDWREHFEDV